MDAIYANMASLAIFVVNVEEKVFVYITKDSIIVPYVVGKVFVSIKEQKSDVYRVRLKEIKE
jgi:hypothetical protein